VLVESKSIDSKESARLGEVSLHSDCKDSLGAENRGRVEERWSMRVSEAECVSIGSVTRWTSSGAGSIDPMPGFLLAMITFAKAF